MAIPRWLTREAVGRWAMPALAVIALVALGPAVLPSWRAAHHGGVAGTFVSTGHVCSIRNGCRAVGSFTSDDGTIHLTHVVYRHDIPVGRTARAVSGRGGRREVYDPAGHDWVVIGLVTLGAAAYLVALVVRRLRR